MGHYIVRFSKYLPGEEWFLPLNVFISEKINLPKKAIMFGESDTNWK